MRVREPLGVHQSGYVPWTSMTGAKTRRQRPCPICGARPYRSCQASRVDPDGVTHWRTLRSYHKER